MKQTYTIQENGQVTLPQAWRERYRLKKGDIVSFEETDMGELKITPRVTIGMNALDAIGKVLKEKGIPLNQLMEKSERIRSELFEEEYPDVVGKIHNA